MDMVKIGRSFFEETAPRADGSRGGADARPAGRVGTPIIDVMVGLGRRLGIDVVAQGLEASCHLDVVKAAGCRLGQGHLFARPQPAEHTEAYLDGFPGRAG
jgi:EAL domain-containing protein (putative c-di-GMP-specific phosphodiesterase class I)